MIATSSNRDEDQIPALPQCQTHAINTALVAVLAVAVLAVAVPVGALAAAVPAAAVLAVLCFQPCKRCDSPAMLMSSLVLGLIKRWCRRNTKTLQAISLFS